MKSPYEVLGVAPTATADEIRKAYRRLAKKSHPDLNPGNKQAEEHFKELSSANDILSDPDKRKRFDSGEIDATGAEKPRQPYYKDYAGAAGARRYENSSGFSDFPGAEDIFADIFARQSRQSRRVRGQDLNYKLTIDFLDAVNGATKRISLPDGGSLDLKIPPGLQDQQVLRLRGKGGPSPTQGEPGDALVEITVRAHRYFVRQGDDIHLVLPITLSEAVLGGRVKVPTPTGSVMLAIPKASSSGKVMRLKGKGVSREGGGGDELITLQIVLPKEPDAELEALISRWNPATEFDPRKDL